MARQEINIFGTSFLDLLSGALAAVIILFVIVPKMSSEEQDALEQMEELNVQIDDLAAMLDRLENSIPQDVFDEIQRQLEHLQATVSEMERNVSNLQERLADVENERESIRQENSRLRERIQELENRQSTSRGEGQGITDGRVFGVDAKVGVVCFWRENVDVDLYVKDLATGYVCYYGAKNQSFGSLMEDITSRSSANDDRYELFYQSEVVPGRYEISVNIYAGSAWNGQPAHVEGYVVMNPGKRNQIKIPYRNITLIQKGVDTIVGTIIVTETNIELQQ